eukprot:TRINITY_DN52_c0_g1_i3.p1 TRINITY_DN52_c0_g1~~TRINITY_DN52_c0_g1_i3.p1  ORF type:complete len:940 (+),score=125.47 TRINITY_DN52_c0_g1_i3:237-3056(+)
MTRTEKRVGAPPLWDKIPLYNKSGLNVVCTAPVGTRGAIQGVWSLSKACLFSHGAPWPMGAFPQTYSDNEQVEDAFGGLPGDGKPFEVIDISSHDVARSAGEVYGVKLLGAFIAVDPVAVTLSWKVMVVSLDDPLAEDMSDIQDVHERLPGTLERVREWVRVCRSAKPEQARIGIGFNEQAVAFNLTMGAVAAAHANWQLIATEGGLGDVSNHRGGDGKKTSKVWDADSLIRRDRVGDSGVACAAFNAWLTAKAAKSRPAFSPVGILSPRLAANAAGKALPSPRSASFASGKGLLSPRRTDSNIPAKNLASENVARNPPRSSALSSTRNFAHEPSAAIGSAPAWPCMTSFPRTEAYLSLPPAGTDPSKSFATVDEDADGDYFPDSSREFAQGSGLRPAEQDVRNCGSEIHMSDRLLYYFEGPRGPGESDGAARAPSKRGGENGAATPGLSQSAARCGLSSIEAVPPSLHRHLSVEMADLTEESNGHFDSGAVGEGRAESTFAATQASASSEAEVSRSMGVLENSQRVYGLESFGSMPTRPQGTDTELARQVSVEMASSEEPGNDLYGGIVPRNGDSRETTSERDTLPSAEATAASVTAAAVAVAVAAAAAAATIAVDAASAAVAASSALASTTSATAEVLPDNGAELQRLPSIDMASSTAESAEADGDLYRVGSIMSLNGLDEPASLKGSEAGSAISAYEVTESHDDLYANIPVAPLVDDYHWAGGADAFPTASLISFPPSPMASSGHVSMFNDSFDGPTTSDDFSDAREHRELIHEDRYDEHRDGRQSTDDDDACDDIPHAAVLLSGGHSADWASLMDPVRLRTARVLTVGQSPSNGSGPLQPRSCLGGVRRKRLKSIGGDSDMGRSGRAGKGPRVQWGWVETLEIPAREVAEEQQSLEHRSSEPDEALVADLPDLPDSEIAGLYVAQSIEMYPVEIY